MCMDKRVNCISIPISKKTFNLRLIGPLTSIAKVFCTLQSTIKKIDTMPPQEVQRFIESIDNACYDLKHSGSDVLIFSQCMASQAKEFIPVDTRTGTDETQRVNALVVDDDERIQSIHCKILESLGCNVDIASNGYEALSMLHTPYDVILIDIQMPGLDGIDTTKQLRKDKSSYTQPVVIAITTTPFEELQSANVTPLFNHYLPKPLDIHKLQGILSTLSRQKC